MSISGEPLPMSRQAGLPVASFSFDHPKVHYKAASL
jgi:hypothetical protein